MNIGEAVHPYSEIDPGEALLSAIGVRPVLSKEIERITAVQRHAAIRTPANIHRLAKAMCHDQLDQPKGDHPKYEKMLDDLTRTYDEAQIEAMIKRAPDDAKMPFMSVAHNAWLYLSARLPKYTYQDATGTENLRPSDPDLFEFYDIFDALDAPLTIFNYIATGMIIDAQVAAMRTIYPTISAAIDEAIAGAVSDCLAEKKSFELAPRAEIGVACWRGADVQIADLQAGYIAAAAQKQAEAPRKTNESALSKEALSGAQETLYGSIK